MSAFFLIALLLATYVFPSSLTLNLSEEEAKETVEEILAAHVKHKRFNEEIARRSLKNFLKEADSTKSYLLAEETAPFEDPSPGLLEKVIADYKNGSFVEYRKMMETMSLAIERHRLLAEENQKNLDDLPEPVPFKIADLTWQKDQEALKQHLLMIYSLQMDSVSKLSEQARDTYFKKVKKYRTAYEEEFLNPNTKEGHFISCVMKAISAALDNHTSYFTPQEANQFIIQIQKRLFGIGALLRDDLSGLTITHIIEGSPAMLSGRLKIDDRIIAVDGEPIVGMDISDAVELIRGPQGTAVHLTLLRDTGEEASKTTEKYDIEIVRDEIVLSETRYESDLEPFGNGVIAHLRLHSFYEDPNSSSAKDLEKELKKIQDENHLKGVILDLRDNTGGLLTEAVHVAGLFMRKGVVVSIKDSAGKLIHLRHHGSRPAWNGPLIILTNRGSASASEIVAQTLQDYGRALVIGDDHTFGKGTYQVFTLDSSKELHVNAKGEYKVTRGLYYTVSGKSPQLHGVLSDIVVPGVYSRVEIGEQFAEYPIDPQTIEPNFIDKFEDVHIFDRIRVKNLFRSGRQEKEFVYTPYLEKLQNNSAQRQRSSQNYQSFLRELDKPYHARDSLENFGQNDIQLEETFNVMKDLLFLMKPLRP